MILSGQLWQSSVHTREQPTCQPADSSSVTRQHLFSSPQPQLPFLLLLCEACLVGWLWMCAFLCVCAAMSDRWCAYVVMRRAAQRPFSLTPREGFRWQHSSLNHPPFFSWSRFLSSPNQMCCRLPSIQRITDKCLDCTDHLLLTCSLLGIKYGRTSCVFFLVYRNIFSSINWVLFLFFWEGDSLS